MKAWFWMLAMLASGVLFWTGCDSDDDDDESDAPPTVVVTNAPAAPDANADFAALAPENLRLTDKFTVQGRGTVYTLECDAVAGAVSYTFTTSFGDTVTVAVPLLAIEHAGADEEFTVSVYATNDDGFNTRTASATVN